MMHSSPGPSIDCVDVVEKLVVDHEFEGISRHEFRVESSVDCQQPEGSEVEPKPPGW